MNNQAKFRFLGVAMLLVTAACSPSGTPSGGGSAVPNTDPGVTVGYVEDARGPAVEAVVIGRSSLSSAELVAPDGRVTAAPTIERDVLPPSPAYPPSVGVGVFGGSGGGFGVGSVLGIPLGGGGPPPPPGPNRARARVPLADMDHYRRNWERYVVRLRLTNAAGDVTVADIPAPAPRSP